MNPKWLDYARRLQAIAQDGMAFSPGPYDEERYRAIRAISVEMMSAYSDEDPERLQNLFAHEIGYATPKLDTRGVVFRDDAILLVKELSDGGWTLPGGWLDVGESPSEAVEKEVREESGYIVRATKLLAVYDKNKHDHPPSAQHIHKLFFLCDLIGGEEAHSIETGGARFFREDAIPELSVTRTTPAQISRMFEHLRHPDWPTDFD